MFYHHQVMLLLTFYLAFGSETKGSAFIRPTPEVTQEESVEGQSNIAFLLT